MNLFVFLLLAVFVIGMIYVNHTKLEAPPREPTPEPVQKSTPEPISEPELHKSNWHTYRTRYVIAIIMTLALITATVIEAVFFN
jgi:hypothetical protein